jgi:Probable lipid transfer
MEGKFVILFSSLSLFLLPSKAQFFGLSGFPSCVPVLSPCLNYLHSETPPPSCCIPLENAIEEQGDCLCSAFKDKNLLDKIKMTQDEMLKFPTKCGLSLPENTNCSAALSSKSILWFFFKTIYIVVFHLILILILLGLGSKSNPN